jgi:TRAP-type transport system periplasmic protein
MSKKSWDKLSDEKKIIQSSLDEAKTYLRQVSRETEAKAIALLKEKGTLINEVSPQEIARMRETIKPVLDKYSKEIGEALVAEVNAGIAKKRGTN